MLLLYFGADLLILDSESSLGKMESPTLSTHLLPVVLQLRAGPYEISSMAVFFSPADYFQVVSHVLLPRTVITGFSGILLLKVLVYLKMTRL